MERKVNNNDNLNILNEIKKEEENLNQKMKLTDFMIIATIVVVAIIAIILLLVLLFKPEDVANDVGDNTLNILEGHNVTIINSTDDNTVVEQEVVDGKNESFDRTYGEIKIVWIDKEQNMISGPLAPKLNDLTPVNYNSDNKKFEETTENDKDWYDYDRSQWANAVNADGSYFVWIPRFAYKIIYYDDYTHSKRIGYSDARGLLKIDQDNTDNTKETLLKISDAETGVVSVGNNYIVHPAFMNDSENDFANNGWDTELSGFWISKYEASMEFEGQNYVPRSESEGSINIAEERFSSIKLVSKPGYSSWRYANARMAFINAYNFNRTMDSHLTKNSEWGAVTYLTHSKYGTTETIKANSDKNYLAGSNTSEEVIYTTYAKQATTYNATGVYDMVGGASEIVATYLNNNSENLARCGGSESYDLCYPSNNKYKSSYTCDENDRGIGDYADSLAIKNYSKTIAKKGDSIYESSNGGTSVQTWNKGTSRYMNNSFAFLTRGGNSLSSSVSEIYTFNAVMGEATGDMGFRVVMVAD